MRDLPGLAHDVEIGSLDRSITQKMIPQINQQLPILARIGINQLCDLSRAYALHGISQQRPVQASFGRTRLDRRYDFRPCQVRLEEIVGDHECAPLVAIQQVVATRWPEIADGRHRSTLLARFSRSTSSARSSSSAGACKKA